MTDPTPPVAVTLTGAPGGEVLVERAADLARSRQARLVGIHVRRADGLTDGGDTPLERHRARLLALGGTVREVVADDVADALVDVVRAEGAGLLVLGATRRTRWSDLVRGSVANRLLRRLGDLDVLVVAGPTGDARPAPRGGGEASRPGSRPATFGTRRRQIAVVAAVLGPVALALLLRPFRDDISLSTVLLLFLSLVVAVAGAGGTAPAVVAAVVGMGLVNWFFTPPYHSVVVSDAENLLALVVFVAIGITVAALLERALHRRAEAERARLEAGRLADDLREGEAEAVRLERANALRTALLRAVSHDLRTPLASIKASVTSLLQQDVRWSPADTSTFLVTIDEEADRLDRLVGNLLDMGRLESGALDVAVAPTTIDELLAGALDGAGAGPDRIRLHVPDDLPAVDVDAPLAERALANLITNAVRYSPDDTPVLVEAVDPGDGRVVLRVVDRGPGIAADERARAVEPFQRLGDAGDGGVGLGLAVARGFAEAMGAELTLDDTPGGGLTATLLLARSPSVHTTSGEPL